MSEPYLKSGESIVLTTDRVSLDRVIWEAMLTTRQLILTDSDNSHFAPRVIPLAGVSTVRSGKAATGEPVIILTHQLPDEDAPETSILTFLQEPLESRKHDRDNWVKKLIELSVSSRAEHVSIETAPAGSGMRPSVRRWVAPDISRPRPENFPAPEPPRDTEITLDEPEPVVIPQIYPAMKEPVEPQEQPEDIPGPESGERGWNGQEQTSSETEALEQPVNRESPGAKIHIPPESLSASILAAVRSLTGDQPARPPVATGHEIPPKEEKHPCDTPIRRTSSLPEEVNESPVSVPPEQQEILPSPAHEDHLPVFEEIERGVMRSSQITETLPEPVGDGEVISAPVEGKTEEAEPEVQVLTQEHIEDEAEVESQGKEAVPVASGGSKEPEAPFAPAHKKPEDPPAGRPGIRPIIIAGAAAVCILLLIAVILFMPPSGIPPEEYRPGTPTTVPVTTTLTPAPALIPSVVPQEGVWVRITSPAYYSGEAGNPGYLQQVSGSGEKRIRMLRSEGLVQVSVEKQDYTIDLLLVEIYVNGTLVTARSTTAPGGSVVLLIDPATGNPPGILSDVTTNTTKTGQLSYY